MVDCCPRAQFIAPLHTRSASQAVPHNTKVLGNGKTIEGFRSEFTAFTQLVFTGVESFANYDQKSLLKANPENAEVWLDLIEKTGTTPEGLGMTGHFLYIGR